MAKLDPGTGGNDQEPVTNTTEASPKPSDFFNYKTRREGLLNSPADLDTLEQITEMHPEWGESLFRHLDEPQTHMDLVLSEMLLNNRVVPPITREEANIQSLVAGIRKGPGETGGQGSQDDGSSDVIYVELLAPNSGSFNNWIVGSFSYSWKAMTTGDSQTVDIGPRQSPNYPRVGYLFVTADVDSVQREGWSVAQGSFSAVPRGLTKFDSINNSFGDIYTVNGSSGAALVITPFDGACYDPKTDANYAGGRISTDYAFAFFILDDALLNKLTIDLCFYPTENGEA